MISVIIPTLNEEHSLGQLIVHLQKNGGDFLKEIIVVDGGSSDQTTFIAQRLGVQVIT